MERAGSAQYAASPYSELVGENQYLRMLFLLGYGPLDISQIRIGDTAMENYRFVASGRRVNCADNPAAFAPDMRQPDGVSILSASPRGRTR